MTAIFILLPYAVVPLLVSLLFAKMKIKNVGLSYFLTGVLIFIYPFIIFYIDDLLHPPKPGGRCLLPQTSFGLGSMFVFLPFSLVIQNFTNHWILKTP